MQYGASGARRQHGFLPRTQHRPTSLDILDDSFRSCMRGRETRRAGQPSGEDTERKKNRATRGAAKKGNSGKSAIYIAMDNQAHWKRVSVGMLSRAGRA